ncbi:MAG: cytochrome c [Gammaproteobacteria bacterium]|nr:cytochrome c [Gammaproteobacteria bacterium]
MMLNFNSEERSQIYYLLTSCLLLLTVSGCSNDVHDHPDLVTGKQLFNYHCSGCHNETGQGNFLKGVPANKGTAMSPEQIKHKIIADENGGTKMPSFPKMGRAEATIIASYLKQINSSMR